MVGGFKPVVLAKKNGDRSSLSALEWFRACRWTPIYFKMPAM